MSDTPRTDALLSGKPCLWREWKNFDFHELQILARQLERENVRLREALESAVGIIKQWHNMGIQDGSPLDVWQIYYDNAPEMKPLRAALRPSFYRGAHATT